MEKNILDTCAEQEAMERNTLNISTTAILASACGVKVAKHGNKAVSSKSSFI